MIRPALLVTGFKGALFVKGLLAAGIRPLRIVSYRQAGDKSDAFDQLLVLSRTQSLILEESRHPSICNEELAFGNLCCAMQPIVAWYSTILCCQNSEGLHRV
jgi:hypothetical protein